MIVFGKISGSADTKDSIKVSSANPPELKKYADKKPQLRLNSGRVVAGVPRGFDLFMNIVINEAIEETKKTIIGMPVIRGNGIVLLEALERIA
ncbi:hypothetical protein LSH36_274g01045 [Paralvinella palmiformis]|uniref:Small nuclear ribonucleoprotein G n=1 Tax=Paralvinella palmiformis TaxID=53620 RepID=A0AAD9JKA4_9ANNE|nr:hypothetical protein LSH36_274g01045 [Paralvinella palmiformis]